MSSPEVQPPEIMLAVTNYIECLQLPPNSQVLIITDNIPKGGIMTRDMLIRRKMAKEISDTLGKAGHRIGMLKLDSTMDREKLHADTGRVLQELDELPKDNGDSTTTVINLVEKLLERDGVYDAASEFGATHNVQFVGSLGFREDDIRVMSQMDKEHLKRIKEASEYFNKFIDEHPQGTFIIKTTDEDDKDHELSVSYNNRLAPFDTEMGSFGSPNPKKLPGKNFSYVNIPGGEMYAAPYPFKAVKGQFSAEGMVFTVDNGFVTNIEILDDLVHLDPAQKELVKIIQEKGRLPVAELGFGFYEMAGIKTYPKGAVLSREKAGPHIGFGKVVSTTLEKDEILRHAGAFTHTDFVFRNAEIVWKGPNGETEKFYSHKKRL